MSKSKDKDDIPNSLSNRDAIDVPDDLSLSDSDPEESPEPFSRKVEELSSSSEEEEEKTQKDQAAPEGKPAFKLAGGSSGFSFRSRSIFDQLDSAIKLTSNQLADDNVLDGTFARPAPPSPPRPAQVTGGGASERTKKASSAKKVPDYLAHPERWTRYNLDDVPETSDKKNSQVAHEFISGLQDRRRSQEAAEDTFTPAFNQDHSSSSEHKIVFTRPSQVSRDEGQSAHKIEQGKKKEIGLFHLDEGQEEEEGGKMDFLHQSSTSKEKTRKRMLEEEEDDLKEEEEKATNVAFSFGKRVKRKNFRKAAEEEDED
ncbi:protein TSSC4 isoform X2 [Astyanax mexicanus]|uniref:U5 small nuclear ribonucleoprotein TSSC4 n=1 Tax=Astyanax mexicanus TaxID=7994 RepID=A0A8T2KQL5_ASTMX|nr:protein TSSC4 isoform X2 [Astyanax mexicanus]XP_022522814.2 protein TSSC4 isoform X2 [Astyanax mexicanus]KAG9260889.1 protein TSSC4 isoform X2 [Astyanax mexicanus]